MRIMKSKKEVIQEAWGVYWGRVSNHHQYDGWVASWVWDFRLELEIEQLNCGSYILVRPKSLKGIEDNNSWQETGYHHWRGVKLTKSPFENGSYYEIGFMSAHSDSFHNQGIKQYNNGFFDENNCHLKPFPTHFRLVKLSDNPLY